MKRNNAQRPSQRRRLQSNQISELTIISADGSNRHVIYEVAELIEAPNWTPDGQWLVFNADGRLFKISPDGGTGPIRINTLPIEDANNDHCLSPDGANIYISSRDGHIYEVSIDGGNPRRITPEQDPARRYTYYLHGVSPDGRTLAYVGLERPEPSKVVTRICVVPVDGSNITELTDGSSLVDGPEYSPDGDWIYYNSEAGAMQPGHAQIHRMKVDGTKDQQLTRDERVNWFPHLSPKGDQVAYISFPAGTIGHPADKDCILRIMDADGSNQRDLDSFFGGQGTINVNSWAPDNKRLAFVTYPVLDT
jgi:Tol biopolymer transport system component